MATEKQVEANRQNAQKSTGPKTEEGKAQSRGNAFKHGMTAKDVLPAEVEALQQQRYLDWCPSFTPATPHQEFQLRQVVDASVRVEQCQSNEILRRIELAEIASASGTKWHLDRRIEASRLGKTLKRDPELAALQLRQTPTGRAWLLNQFQILLLGVPAQGKTNWTRVESNQLLDLLGKPRLLRVVLLEDDTPFTDPKAAREMILQEMAVLEAEQANAVVENAKLRLAHVQGLVTDSDASLKLIRRYELTAQRRYDKFIREIRKAQKAPKPQSTASKPECETNPIPVTPEAKPTVAPPETTLPGNRHYRRKLQKEARHEAHLAKRSACRA